MKEFIVNITFLVCFILYCVIAYFQLPAFAYPLVAIIHIISIMGIRLFLQVFLYFLFYFAAVLAMSLVVAYAENFPYFGSFAGITLIILILLSPIIIAFVKDVYSKTKSTLNNSFSSINSSRPKLKSIWQTLTLKGFEYKEVREDLEDLEDELIEEGASNWRIFHEVEIHRISIILQLIKDKITMAFRSQTHRNE